LRRGVISGFPEFHPMIRHAMALVGLAAIGCGGTDPAGGNSAPLGMAPTGNAVFDTHCLHCHAATAKPGGPPRKGPNLAMVGTERSPGWLADHVKHPQSHKADSTMPEFASKLTAEELKSVTEFMSGLK
jgi:mono/diheme cytochrome c family protein